MNNQNLYSQFSQFMQNPGQMLSKMGIPSDALSNPDKAVQYLMDSGKISQAQYIRARNIARSFQNGN